MERTVFVAAGLPYQDRPIRIHEDNAACLVQVASGYIKADRTKHISPHLFGYTQELIESKQVEATKVASADNLADLLTKALPPHKHRKLVHAAGMRLLSEITS